MLDIIWYLILLYLLYKLALFLYNTLTAALIWTWMMLGFTQGARFRRIVRRARREHQSITDVYRSEMERISEVAADRIIRR